MNKNITEYLNLVCVQVKSKQRRLSTRAELMSHIQASVTELKQTGMDEKNAVQTALERMGNPTDIGKQISSFNAPWQNLVTMIVGISLLVMLFIWLGAFRNIHLFNLSALIFTILMTSAFVLIGGLSRLTILSAIVRGRTAALYAGGIGMVIGVVQTLGGIGDLATIGIGLSFCITSILYGLLTSAVLTSVGHLCRPLESAEIRKILGWEDFEL